MKYNSRRPHMILRVVKMANSICYMEEIASTVRKSIEMAWHCVYFVFLATECVTTSSSLSQRRPGGAGFLTRFAKYCVHEWSPFAILVCQLMVHFQNSCFKNLADNAFFVGTGFLIFLLSPLLLDCFSWVQDL